MGEPHSPHMDGRVLSEILRPERLPSVRYGRSVQRDGHDGQDDDAALSPEEQMLVTERLRSLGYVG